MKNKRVEIKRLEIENISADELLNEMMAKLLSRYKMTLIQGAPDLETKDQEDQEYHEEFITIKKTCEILKITKPTLGRWRKQGIIVEYKIGNGVRFKKSEILESLIKITR